MPNFSNTPVLPKKREAVLDCPELVTQAITQTESQVIVHVRFANEYSMVTNVRIWLTTFLIDNTCGHKSKLLHKEGISLYPEWTPVPPYQSIVFTLIFEGLPKGCTRFDLLECIPEPGGFKVKNIQRNNLDVYTVDIQ